MKQNIEHISPYVPFGLNTLYNLSDVISLRDGVKDEVRNKELTQANLDFVCQFCKPILRPLTKIRSHFEPIFDTDKEVNEFLSYETLTPFSIEDLENFLPEYIPYGSFKVLIKHHFDVFGLIEKGLAVDINTLSVELPLTSK